MNRVQLDRLLLAWPGTASDVKWQDDLVYTVGGKMFAVHALRGAHAGSLSFKVEPERFLELTDRDGIEPAPYLARAHWVWLRDPSVLPPHELRTLLQTAYGLIAAKLTKKLRRELGFDGA
jgi:predicted DNA-binding protein (MmcQ/YjbR family)